MYFRPVYLYNMYALPWPHWIPPLVGCYLCTFQNAKLKCFVIRAYNLNFHTAYQTNRWVAYDHDPNAVIL